LRSADSEEFDRYDSYFRRNISPLFRQRVEELLEARFGMIEESLLENLAEIMRTCQDKVLQQLRAIHRSPPNPTREEGAVTAAADGAMTSSSNHETGPLSAWVSPPLMSEETASPTLGDIQNVVPSWPNMGSELVSDSGYGSIRSQLQDPLDELAKYSEFLQFHEEDQSHSYQL
jgi:hypothetical protein